MTRKNMCTLSGKYFLKHVAPFLKNNYLLALINLSLVFENIALE